MTSFLCVAIALMSSLLCVAIAMEQARKRAGGGRGGSTSSAGGGDGDSGGDGGGCGGGACLVFLPGTREIQDVHEALLQTAAFGDDEAQVC